MQDGKAVILCVDDEQDIRDSLRMILEASGYVVAEAATGAAGVDKYTETKPDLVIVDMMMESADAGLKLAQKLKSMGDAPVYLLSSMTHALSDQIDPQSFGLNGAIQKPVDPDMLLRTIKQELS